MLMILKVYDDVENIDNKKSRDIIVDTTQKFEVSPISRRSPSGIEYSDVKYKDENNNYTNYIMMLGNCYTVVGLINNAIRSFSKGNSECNS